MTIEQLSVALSVKIDDPAVDATGGKVYSNDERLMYLSRAFSTVYSILCGIRTDRALSVIFPKLFKVFPVAGGYIKPEEEIVLDMTTYTPKAVYVRNTIYKYQEPMKVMESLSGAPISAQRYWTILDGQLIVNDGATRVLEYSVLCRNRKPPFDDVIYLDEYYQQAIVTFAAREIMLDLQNQLKYQLISIETKSFVDMELLFTKNDLQNG